MPLNLAPLKELIPMIKEEEVSEVSMSMSEDSQNESMRTIDKSMSILDCSLNLDPEYTSNNKYISHKHVQFK